MVLGVFTCRAPAGRNLHLCCNRVTISWTAPPPTPPTPPLLHPLPSRHHMSQMSCPTSWLCAGLVQRGDAGAGEHAAAAVRAQAGGRLRAVGG